MTLINEYKKTFARNVQYVFKTIVAKFVKARMRIIAMTEYKG